MSQDSQNNQNSQANFQDSQNNQNSQYQDSQDNQTITFQCTDGTINTSILQKYSKLVRDLIDDDDDSKDLNSNSNTIPLVFKKNSIETAIEFYTLFENNNYTNTAFPSDFNPMQLYTDSESESDSALEMFKLPKWVIECLKLDKELDKDLVNTMYQFSDYMGFDELFKCYFCYLLLVRNTMNKYEFAEYTDASTLGIYNRESKHFFKGLIVPELALSYDKKPCRRW